MSLPHHQLPVVGDDITITVFAPNFGVFAEIFNVTAYYNNSIIFVESGFSLLPNQTTVIEAKWQTSSFEAGTYRIRAVAEAVPGEVNTENNAFIDGQVTLRVGPPAC